MGVEERKFKIGYGLEASVRQTYERSLDAIKKSNDPIRYLDELGSSFRALGGSRPGNDKIKWARDLITAYRNLGRIFTTLLPEQSLTYSTQLGEILSGYEDLLEEFGEKGTPEAVNDALKYLVDVRDILIEYEYDDLSELRGKLKDAKEISDVLTDLGIEGPSGLREKLEGVEDLKTEIGDLERELSEFENL